MSAGAKAGAYVQRLKGKLQKSVGRASDDPRLENKGRKNMLIGKGREFGQNIKRTFKR